MVSEPGVIFNKIPATKKAVKLVIPNILLEN
jgi:hypothetical protein